MKRQIANLAPDSDQQLERIGIRQGERVIDLGCGPGGVLHLLGKRVGPTGSVLGIERDAHFVELAHRFVASHALRQVEVREGDAYATGLPRGSFDGAHMRLVLVNVPEPERIVREMVSLVKPGGWIASFEADFLAHVCDPPIAAWDRLLAAYVAYSAARGIDLHIGRRTQRLFREAGVEALSTDAVVHVYPPGMTAGRSCAISSPMSARALSMKASSAAPNSKSNYRRWIGTWPIPRSSSPRTCSSG